MSNNTPAVVFVAVIVYLLVSVGMLALSFSARYIAWRSRRFAKLVGLDLSAELEPLVGTRVARRQRGAGAGIIVATAATGPLTLLGYDARSTSTGWALLLVGGFVTGLALGVAVTAATLPRDDRAIVRYARPRAVGLADYIAPLERNGARIVVGAAVLALLCSIVLASFDPTSATLLPPSTFSVVCALLAVLALGLFEILGHRIVARPQPAGSTEELAWDDALRAWTVRDLATAPLTVGLYTVVLGLSDLLTAIMSRLSQTPALLLANIGAYLLFATVVVIAIIAMASSPQQHFLRRLWPELVPPPMSTPADVKG